MTITLSVIAAAVVVVGLIVLGVAVRSIKLAAPRTRRSGSVVPDPAGVGERHPDCRSDPAASAPPAPTQ